MSGQIELRVIIFYRNHKLVINRVALVFEGCGGPFAKGFDFVSHHINPTIVRGIDVQHIVVSSSAGVEFLAQRRNGARFPCPRWTIKQEMHRAVGLQHFVEQPDDMVLAFDVFEGCGAVFFDPRGIGLFGRR